MKHFSVLFSVLALVLIVAVTVYAVDSSTWGKIKGALRDASPLAKQGDEGTEEAIRVLMDDVNVQLAAEGANYRVAIAEYLTSGEIGKTVISKDVGNKQHDSDFVPFDVRRVPWSGPVDGPDDNITYAVDQTKDAVPPIGGLTADQTDAAIDRAMATWDGVDCSTLPITRNPDFKKDLGVLAGSRDVVADIQHAGWRDLDFEEGVLSVTYTLDFVDGSGNWTDIDDNGKLDVAFREIYYDPSVSWADDGVTDFDVETVALHEAGHGLSQDHFGTITIDEDGHVEASPRAVMNAIYQGPLRILSPSDTGGHCSNWSEWPNH